MARVLVPLIDGVEEMEAVIVIDVLRRAGWDVVSAGVGGPVVTASRGVKLVPDAAWNDVDPAGFDALMIPGGRGARALAAEARVLDAVRAFRRAGKWVGAICAGPLVLQAAGVLEGVPATCHPSVAGELAGERSRERVVAHDRILTSQGPGTAFEFALALIRAIDGEAAADAVAGPMVL
jgi:protein deglycase